MYLKLTSSNSRKMMAHVPIIRSPMCASLMRELSMRTELIRPGTKYLIPSSTLICDSMTNTAVAEEKALITGIEMNSKMKPEISHESVNKG